MPSGYQPGGGPCGSVVTTRSLFLRHDLSTAYSVTRCSEDGDLRRIIGGQDEAPQELGVLIEYAYLFDTARFVESLVSRARLHQVAGFNKVRT